MSTIKQLKPANRADVIIYMPYYSKEKHRVLPVAISLYQQGRLEGERQIEGGNNLSFAASWYVSKLPNDNTRCRLQFDGQPELSYEITLPNSEFIEFLIDVIIGYEQTRSTDFPRAFYRKLLNFVDESK